MCHLFLSTCSIALALYGLISCMPTVTLNITELLSNLNLVELCVCCNGAT
uniref:Uncharacterized protein n=1 Tax=Arundo donax TaxID=35708 RepID=A0A0A9BC04_ARUDO